ncbi:DUF3817 domain-containing protein [Spirosoma luteolum]
MFSSLKTGLGRLHAIGLFEGLSFLALLGIAMPVKYLAGDPTLVRVIGPIHGLLFVFYVLAAISVSIDERWSFWRTTWKVLLASVVPFGTFYISRAWLDRQKKGA